MKQSIASTGRAVFVGMLLTVGVYGSLDAMLDARGSGAHGRVADCGDAANPCQLPTLRVTAVRSAEARTVSAETPAPIERAALAES
ncbi:MAG TPA: hypothetical protein VFQ39_13165 [Longimicrobium sp.]|nr:hypothetical protein [Longimicrobium sp.]